MSEKPNYEVGSSSKLSFAKNTAKKDAIAAAWTLDDDDGELINQDDLLDEEDKVKPDPSTLRGERNYHLLTAKTDSILNLLLVCGTTGKRKACKDCSCGLAEELATENGGSKVSTNEPKSSCGSVSLHYNIVLKWSTINDKKNHYFYCPSVISVMHSDVPRVLILECRHSNQAKRFNWLAVY